MGEKRVLLSSLLTTMLWTIGLAVSVTNMFIGPDVGALGAALIGAAIAVDLRCLCHREHERTRQGEANAFELGRDHERGLRVLR